MLTDFWKFKKSVIVKRTLFNIYNDFQSPRRWNLPR